MSRTVVVAKNGNVLHMCNFVVRNSGELIYRMLRFSVLDLFGNVLKVRTKGHTRDGIMIPTII